MQAPATGEGFDALHAVSIDPAGEFIVRPVDTAAIEP